MLPAETVLRKSDDVVATEVAPQEMVLLHLSKKKYYALEGTGRDVWQLLDGKRSLSLIGEELCRRYEVEPPEAIEAVREHATELLQEGLVVEESGG